jgi:hypothetical protein
MNARNLVTLNPGLWPKLQQINHFRTVKLLIIYNNNNKAQDFLYHIECLLHCTCVLRP